MRRTLSWGREWDRGFQDGLYGREGRVGDKGARGEERGTEWDEVRVTGGKRGVWVFGKGVGLRYEREVFYGPHKSV